MTEHPQRYSDAQWHRYVLTFLALGIGGMSATFLFILLVDPFGISPIKLPLKPSLVTTQRYMYPQILRGRRFDSILVGTSTTMLIDPKHLDAPFGAKFANVAMASATAWEQSTLLDLFLRETKDPKVIVIGIDVVWCQPDADVERITFRGFPDWLYDDTRWNDYASLLNRLSLASAIRKVRAHFGFYAPDIREDGMQKFLPDDSEYDPERARRNLGESPSAQSTGQTPPLPSADVQSRLPALEWLDRILSRLPATTIKVLSFMPVYASSGDSLTACKTQISALARRHGATVMDWRIASSITQNASNYWDPLHYRVPIAEKIAREIPQAVLNGQPSSDGTYRLLVR